MKIQILCTTMYQNDFSKLDEMNIRSNVIFANQTNENKYDEIIFKNYTAKMITTDTRGVSKNRNIAIDNIDADTDYIIFADDDLIFYDNFEDAVKKEIKNHLNAEVIKFNVRSISDRKISMTPTKKFYRINRKKSTSWGVCALAISVKTLKEKNLKFNERFGPGAENYCGEDTIFIQEMFKKKVKVYVSPLYIADINQDSSLWFEGYNENYFLSSGAALYECYHYLCYLISIYSAYKFSKRRKCKYKFKAIIGFYIRGITNEKKCRKRI